MSYFRQIKRPLRVILMVFFLSSCTPAYAWEDINYGNVCTKSSILPGSRTCK